MIMAVVVHAANIQDRDGAKIVLVKLKDWFPRLELIWADGGLSRAVDRLDEDVRGLGVGRSSNATSYISLWCCPSDGSSSEPSAGLADTGD